MAQFINPFPGMTPDRKLNNAELVRAIRQNVAAEEEATHLYEAIVDATDNPVAQKVLHDIANDERVHKGQFLRLLEMFTGDEGKFMLQGANETDKISEGVAVVPWISPNFNPLDPLGIMNLVGKDIDRIVAATGRR